MPRRQVRGEVVALGGYVEAVRRLKGCRVEADGLFCEGALVARRAEVRAATVVFDGGWHVRLETSEGKRLDVEVEDESVAESMVEALEVEPARTRTSVRAASPFVCPWTALAAMSATLLIGIVFRQLGWAPARVGSMAVAGAVGFLSGAGLSMLRMDVPSARARDGRPRGLSRRLRRGPGEDPGERREDSLARPPRRAGARRDGGCGAASRGDRGGDDRAGGGREPSSGEAPLLNS